MSTAWNGMVWYGVVYSATEASGAKSLRGWFEGGRLGVQGFIVSFRV